MNENYEAKELYLYVINTENLYNRFKAAVNLLQRKVNKGTYNKELAPKAFKNIVDSAAKVYCREFAMVEQWCTIFPATARKLVMTWLAEDFETEYKEEKRD